MTKVGVIGIGKVGSALAFSLLFHPKVTEIHLVDELERKLRGEYEDLDTANLLLKANKHIQISNLISIQECDIIFVAAGQARQNSQVSDEELFQINIATVTALIRNLDWNKVYIITNPSKMLGEKLGVKYLGDDLDMCRETYNKRSGKWVLDQKGFTNWGIAAEAYKVIN